MIFLIIINTILMINAITPTNRISCVPKLVMIMPDIDVPMVVPKLTDVKNNPLAKSGACGAADMIQY